VHNSASRIGPGVDVRGAGGYVIGGELVVMKARGEVIDPLFSPAEAAALGLTTMDVDASLSVDGLTHRVEVVLGLGADADRA